ncbi:MAG: YqiA/YcfP family alpha/beta fold hydrolase [Colwellia sp.]
MHQAYTQAAYTKAVLYIHGFNSSPLSVKAEQTKAYLKQNFPNTLFVCPQLKSTPAQAIEQLEAILNDDTYKGLNWSLIGSSLGGYFSDYLAQKYNLKAVLINPAVKPYELLQGYLGEQVNPYTKERFQVTPDFVHFLKSIDQIKLDFNNETKNNYRVMLQMGDEVLDYQQAVEKYEHCHVVLEQGGDHSFIDYDRHLPEIIKFLA